MDLVDFTNPAARAGVRRQSGRGRAARPMGVVVFKSTSARRIPDRRVWLRTRRPRGRMHKILPTLLYNQTRVRADGRARGPGRQAVVFSQRPAQHKGRRPSAPGALGGGDSTNPLESMARNLREAAPVARDVRFGVMEGPRGHRRGSRARRIPAVVKALGFAFGLLSSHQPAAWQTVVPVPWCSNDEARSKGPAPLSSPPALKSNALMPFFFLLFDADGQRHTTGLAGACARWRWRFPTTGRGRRTSIASTCWAGGPAGRQRRCSRRAGGELSFLRPGPGVERSASGARWSEGARGGVQGSGHGFDSVGRCSRARAR